MDEQIARFKAQDAEKEKKKKIFEGNNKKLWHVSKLTKTMTLLLLSSLVLGSVSSCSDIPNPPIPAPAKPAYTYVRLQQNWWRGLTVAWRSRDDLATALMANQALSASGAKGGSEGGNRGDN
jgi:hypothetical protein